jgi:serine/threonine-protein kinase
MATVYLARLSGVGGFQRLVAIKRLHPHLAREPEFIEMFLEEARLAARIHHPNVVPILEIGQAHGYYIVMEYVEGDTLGRLLARSAQTGARLPTKVGLRVFIDMLAGLHAAHELQDDNGNALGIVHRDVSPQNVLVGVDGSSRLSDFGVARATSKLSTTRTGQLKGKLAYMAPEQARGLKDIDRRADIFAAGIVLWEVLTCRRLFKGDGEADTLNRVVNEPIPPVRSVAPAVPAALEAVVARALERDRSKRYETAAEFADALERASRILGALGAHKEVAAHLEAVLGTEISQQRDAVRAWLARSEPSRHGVEPLPRPDAHVTRAERAPAVSGPSSVSSMRNVPSEPSVASAVLSTRPVQPNASAPLSASLAAGASPRRTRMWPWVTALAAAVAGAALWMGYYARGGFATAVAPAGMPAPSAAPLTIVTPATTTVPAAVTLTASTAAGGDAAPPRAAATAAAPPTRPGWRPPRVVPARAAEAPAAATQPPANPPPGATATATSAPVPDDISRTPYR